MKITPRLRQELNVLAWTVCLVAGMGGIIGFFVAVSLGIRPYIMGIAQGMFTGAFIAVSINLISAVYPNTEHGQWMKRLSFKKSLVLSSVVYLFVIAFGIRLGVAIFYQTNIAEFRWLALETIISLIISGVLAIGINLGQQMNRMLGQGVMKNFLSGAYHKPREEERVFLFIDVTGSTGIAERIGPIKFHELLDRFFYDLTDPVLEHKGEIHKYVGDEVIISWPVTDGEIEGNAIACFFAIEKQVTDHKDFYLENFGFVPTFRGAINAGPVVTGEIGDIKREIVFLGDTVNTASRILTKASELDQSLLCASHVAAKISLPGYVNRTSLGTQSLRGRQKEVELLSLSKAT